MLEQLGEAMSGQHFSLRWNNHQSHVLSAFDALLQNEALVDCTLVCEDSNVKAHKVTNGQEFEISSTENVTCTFFVLGGTVGLQSVLPENLHR